MVTDFIKQPQTPNSPQLVTHALLETFSRVLLWCGTKNFQCNDCFNNNTFSYKYERALNLELFKFLN